MKKWVWIMALAFVLSGCGTEETLETVGDEYLQQVVQEKKELVLDVPKNAMILESSAGTEYICDGYSVATQVLESGDLSGTLQTVTGLASDALTVVETSAGGVDRYESVWTAAGEGGDTVCRVLILDDGAWHYCVSISAPAEQAGRLQQIWQGLFNSARIL
jgi:hypothetical protein